MQSGIPLALASAVLFGASTPLAKPLLGAVGPWLMAGFLYVGAGIGLLAVHLSRKALRLPAAEAPLRRSDIPWLLAVILFGGVLGPRRRYRCAPFTLRGTSDFRIRRRLRRQSVTRL